MSAPDITATDWLDNAKAATQAAGTSLPALMALLGSMPADVPADILLDILRRIAQLLEPQEGWTLENLVSDDSHSDGMANILRQKAIVALLDGWNSYGFARLWEIEMAPSTAAIQAFAQQLTTFGEDLEKARSSASLALRMLGVAHEVPLGSHGWAAMAENLKYHQQALALYSPQPPDAGGEAPCLTPSPRRLK